MKPLSSKLSLTIEQSLIDDNKSRAYKGVLPSTNIYSPIIDHTFQLPSILKIFHDIL